MEKKLIKIWTICLFMSGGLVASAQQKTQIGDLHCIPLPQEIMEDATKAPFMINSSTTIVYEKGNKKLASTARLLADYINEVTGTKVKLATKAPKKNCIVLKVDPSINHKDGYKLNITADKVTVTGATEAGVFYGCQTIHKSLPITKGSEAIASLPAGEVNDFPQYDYRGFMIDVGRHFFPKEYLKELIDVMALHNINYFHWHLTEDQGWRIEIKKYPKLTEIGSYRKKKKKISQINGDRLISERDHHRSRIRKIRRHSRQWLLYARRRQGDCRICGRTIHYCHSRDRHAGTHVGGIGILSGTGMYGWSV